MIHSTYSFRLVKESVLKKASSALFFFNAAAKSSGRRTIFFSESIQSKISRTFAGLSSFRRSASDFTREANADQVSSKAIRLSHWRLGTFKRLSQPLSRVKSVWIFEV